jgi:tetratricopeptide (TPR) repeat protein
MRAFVAFQAAVLLLSACGTSTESPSPTAPTTASPSATTAGATDPSATPVIGRGGAAGAASWAFSDSHPFYADVWAIFATLAESQICSVPAAQPQSMDLDTAVANARAFLDDGAGSSAMEAFDRSPEGSTVEKAKAAAAAALIDGNEAGALAALLAAARLESDNPRHLVNAAGLLPAFGLASEALAFLAAAEALGEPEGTPFGVDQRAVHLNNQGRALLSLQRWDEAAPLLSEAVELDPTLSEAAANLSLALLCQGDRDEAMRYAKAGRYRKPMRFTERDTVSTPDPEDAYDLDVGVQDADALVPALSLPETPEQGAALRQYFGTVKEDLIGRTIDRAERQAELQTTAASASTPPIARTRTDDIMLAISELTAEGGKTADLWQEVGARSDEAFAVWDEHWGPAGTVEQISDGCGDSDDYAGCMQAECIPATRTAHASWIDAVTDLDRAVRSWADAYHPLATAIVAHLGDPAMHDLATMRIQEALDNAFLTLVSRAEEFTTFEDNSLDTCVRAPDPPPDESAQLGNAPSGSPCPMQTGQWSIKVAFVSISIDCSDWSVEAATPGTIGVFAQISSKRGETTVFVGPTASTGVGPFEASTRSGFYVTVSDTTGVRDFGCRVEPGSVSAGAGPLSVTVASAESMDFSFVGITAYLPGL